MKTKPVLPVLQIDLRSAESQPWYLPGMETSCVRPLAPAAHQPLLCLPEYPPGANAGSRI